MNKDIPQGVIADMEQMRRFGAYQERERIIKVIEAEQTRRHEAGVLELLGFDRIKSLIIGADQ